MDKAADSGTVVEAAPYWRGRGTPEDFGRIVAAVTISSSRGRLAEAMVDVRGLPPALLIGGFYSGFLHQIHDRDPELLSDARRIRWTTDHEFQREQAERAMESFVPRD